jgi:hypothetical protein
MKNIKEKKQFFKPCLKLGHVIIEPLLKNPPLISPSASLVQEKIKNAN